MNFFISELFVFALVKCIFCFSFPWFRKCTDNKTCFFITFTALFLTINSYFTFFDHLNNTFETTLSCALVIVWNYYVNYQMTHAGSRTTVTSKLELFVTISDRFLNNCHKDLHLRCCRRPRSNTDYRHFLFAELDFNQFEANSPFI